MCTLFTPVADVCISTLLFISMQENINVYSLIDTQISNKIMCNKIASGRLYCFLSFKYKKYEKGNISLPIKNEATS